MTDLLGRAAAARAARQVVAYYRNAEETPGNYYATGQATAALAVWSALTGLDTDHALDLARHIVEEAES